MGRRRRQERCKKGRKFLRFSYLCGCSHLSRCRHVPADKYLASDSVTVSRTPKNIRRKSYNDDDQYWRGACRYQSRDRLIAAGLPASPSWFRLRDVEMAGHVGGRLHALLTTYRSNGNENDYMSVAPPYWIDKRHN